MMQTRRSLCAALALGAILSASIAHAQSDYPTKPIKLVVGYAAGGPTDIIARLIGQDISATLGQPVVIENRTGANGNIATEFVATAPNDGYTLIANTLSHNVNPLLQPSLVKYDPVKGFAPVSLAVVVPQFLVVAANSPYKTLGDLVKAAQAKPASVFYGSAGAGSSAHLAASLLGNRSNTHMTQIPFRGNAPALNEVMSGRVSFMFYPMVGVADYVTSGKLRILAVTTPKRRPDFPQVPTMAELGFQGFEEYVGPVGFLAPAGTPQAVVEKLNLAIGAALAKPALQSRLAGQGAVVKHLGPNEYRDWLREDNARWAQLIKVADIKAE